MLGWLSVIKLDNIWVYKRGFIKTDTVKKEASIKWLITWEKKSIPNNELPENKRALQRENEAPGILSGYGYNIERLPEINWLGVKNPDYKIDWEIFDNYAPSTGNVRNIWSNIKDYKVDSGQTKNIVLHLADSPADIALLKEQFKYYSMPWLNRLIIIKKDNSVLEISF